MLSEKILDILVCPKCKCKPEYETKKDLLICKRCQLKFLIKDNIPIMLIEEAEKY